MRITTYWLTVFIVLAFALSAAPPKRKAAVPARSTATTAIKSKSRSSSGTSHARSIASKGRARYGKPVAAAPPRYRGQSQPTTDRYTQIQRALASRGYFHGEPDGGWGAESQQALRQFQKDQNLPPTGRISSLSLIALGLGPQRDTASVASAITPSPLP